MSSESTCDALHESLLRIADIVKDIDPNSLIVTEADAMAIAKEILSDIPENCRGLYPKDGLLAAIAYAQVYYTWRR